MFELLTLFITGGGSAAMGSILKGIFGSIADNREHKHQRKLARAIRDNENAIKFQQALLGNPEDSKYVRTTRRMLALILMSTFAAITILCTLYPSVPLITFSNLQGAEKVIDLFIFSFTFPAKQTPMVVTTGHITLFACTVVYPMVAAFYFTPGGRR